MTEPHICLHEKDWDRKDQEDKDLKDSIIEILLIHNKGISDKFDFLEKRMNKDSLEAKEAIRAAFEAQKETVTVALTASDKAALKAENAFEKRFDGISELINNIAQQQKDFMPRQEAESKFTSMNARIDLQSVDMNKISDKQNASSGEKEGKKDIIALFFSIVAFISVLAGLLFGYFPKE